MTKYAAFEAAASTLEGIRGFPADSILICCLPLADRLLLTRETPCFEFRFNGTKTRLGGVFLHQNGETYENKTPRSTQVPLKSRYQLNSIDCI